jgi:hypothetical protein
MRPVAFLLVLLLSGCAGAGARAPKALSCASAQAIRDFKDAVRSINPTAGIDEKWAGCLCAARADAAGVNDPRPTLGLDLGLPAFPAYDKGHPKRSLRRERDFFLKNLPVDKEQAAALVSCVWDRDMGPIR